MLVDGAKCIQGNMKITGTPGLAHSINPGPPWAAAELGGDTGEDTMCEDLLEKTVIDATTSAQLAGLSCSSAPLADPTLVQAVLLEKATTGLDKQASQSFTTSTSVQ